MINSQFSSAVFNNYSPKARWTLVNIHRESRTENRNKPELSIPAAGQKDRELWGREWRNVISFPECSFPSTSGRETKSSGSNHFRRAWPARIDADCAVKPDRQNHHNSVISKWLLPELSFSNHWSRGTKTLRTRLYTIYQPLEYSGCRPSTKCEVFIVFLKFWKKI